VPVSTRPLVVVVIKGGEDGGGNPNSLDFVTNKV
jgi:hypothetical protein